MRLLNKATTVIDGDVHSLFGVSPGDPAVVEIAITGTASVSVEGRLAPDLPWVEIANATATRLASVAHLPQVRARVTAGTGTFEVTVNFPNVRRLVQEFWSNLPIVMPPALHDVATLTPVTLPAFVYEPETEALVATYTTAPTRRRKRTINSAIRRMKNLKDANGVSMWSKLLRFGKVGADLQATYKDWKDPTFTYTPVGAGSPTFVADKTLAGSSTYALKTGILLSALDPNSHAVMFYTPSASTATNPLMGAQNSSSVGIRLFSRLASGYPSISSASTALATMGVTDDWLGSGFFGFSRRDANNIQPFRGPVNRGAAALTSQSLTGNNFEMYVLGSNNNGSISSAGQVVSAWCIASVGLSDVEMALVADVMQSLDVEFSQGEFNTYDAGYDDSEVQADVIIYGTTAPGEAAAREAIRQGLTVKWCGGWRDRHVGGMSAGGLGALDVANLASLGGLPRWILNSVQTLGSKPADQTPFEPRFFTQVTRGLFDPRMPNGVDVPIYWSNGVAKVRREGTRVTGFQTVDGRIFRGRYFVDASYEGDLIKRAGLSVTKGREAAGTGTEAQNGFRGLQTPSGGQYRNHLAANLLNIDPFYLPGKPASGLLPNIQGFLSEQPAIGSADGRSQAFNFRVIFTSAKNRMVPLDSTPPPGYDKWAYEPLLRTLAQDPSYTIGDVLRGIDTANIAPAMYDINASWGLSTDLMGGSTGYLDAEYATRELIWKRHENFFRGLMYVLQYENDARVPAALRTSALGYGFDMFHFSHPHPLDKAHWPTAFYVREGYRLVGDLVLNANDITAVDGTDPRSAKTIAAASYTIDSHFCGAYADNSTGSWRIWLEGAAGAAGGGADAIAPLPYEVILPKASECVNLASVFAVSATHLAFASIRMEYTTMCLAQAAIIAIKIATMNGDQALQDVDYPTLRTALLATPSLPSEPAPVLPLKN